MTLELVANNAKRKPVTIARLASIEFPAIRELRGMTKVRRLKKLHSIADDVRAMAVIASEIVAMDKAELVANVDDKHEHFGPFFMQLARAGACARLLADLIVSAEVRLAVALAVVEGDGGVDDVDRT